MATKKYKGKYPGPDSLKGDTAKLKIYRAAIRAGTSKKSALKKASGSSSAAPAPTPAAPTPAAPVQAPNTGATAANSSGNIELMTNYELEREAADAAEQYNSEVLASKLLEQQALIQRDARSKEIGAQAKDARGRLNSSVAYRGLMGETALGKSSELKKEINDERASNESNYQNLLGQALGRRTQARNTKDSIDAAIKLGKQEYTNSMSATAPIGSPEASGAVATAPRTSTSTSASATKSYKGKYPGPEKLKGNAAKLKIYRAALRAGTSKKKALKKALGG